MRETQQTPRRSPVFQELALRLRKLVRDEHANGLSGAERFIVRSADPLVIEQLASDLVLEDGDPDFSIGAGLSAYIAAHPLDVGDQVWCLREGQEWTAVEVTGG